MSMPVGTSGMELFGCFALRPKADRR